MDMYIEKNIGNGLTVRIKGGMDISVEHQFEACVRAAKFLFSHKNVEEEIMLAFIQELAMCGHEDFYTADVDDRNKIVDNFIEWWREEEHLMGEGIGQSTKQKVECKCTRHQLRPLQKTVDNGNTYIKYVCVDCGRTKVVQTL